MGKGTERKSTMALGKQSIQSEDPRTLKVAVIGGGPGGYPAAVRAAQMGAQVTLIENRDLGGTCLNRGCIPTKALLHSANVFHEAKNGAARGVVAPEVTLDFPRAMEYKNGIVKNLVKGLGSIIKSNGITVVQGTGSVVDPATIRIVETKQEIKAERIIIATGSVPLKLPITGADLPGVITSDEALSLTTLPERILIIGGGVIGIEFAQIFNRMGTHVTVVEMLPQIIPQEDSEMAAKLKTILTKEGIAFYTDTTVEKIRENGTKLSVTFGNHEQTVDLVLLAVGRAPFTAGLGVETIGVKMEKKTIAVNEHLETNVAGIYAVGDVIGNYMLAHVATAEGEHAAQNALGGVKPMDYRVVPRALYTSPEMASVGLTEQEAKKKYGQVKVGKFSLAASGKAAILGDKGGMVKIIAEPRYGEVVGAHILAPHATDLIAEAALGIQLEATLEEFAHTIHAHPTLSESIMEAALDADGHAIHVPAKKKK